LDLRLTLMTAVPVRLAASSAAAVKRTCALAPARAFLRTVASNSAANSSPGDRLVLDSQAESAKNRFSLDAQTSTLPAPLPVFSRMTVMVTLRPRRTFFVCGEI
jgi:hypothetical protein